MNDGCFLYFNVHFQLQNNMAESEYEMILDMLNNKNEKN